MDRNIENTIEQFINLLGRIAYSVERLVKLHRIGSWEECQACRCTIVEGKICPVCSTENAR